MLKLARQARILDLDGSIVNTQVDLLSRLETVCRHVGARDLGPHTRYMATRAQMRRLSARLDTKERHCLTLYGSGDFHHVTAELIRAFQVSEPLSVIVFDRHPDWDWRSPVPCCGSWVLDVLRIPHIHRIVVLGLGSEDIGGWRVNVGSVRGLQEGRVALYPSQCPVSYGAGAKRGNPAQPSPDFLAGPLPGTQTILWQTLKPDDPSFDTASVLKSIFADLPTQQVYVSIDKDCLTPESAITNWEPGHLSLGQVLDGIRLLAELRDIVGADITGEYSRPDIASPLFRYLAQSDRPACAPGQPQSRMPEPTVEQLIRNEATNIKLLAAFGFDVN